MFRTTILLLFFLQQDLHACSIVVERFKPSFDQVNEDSYLIPEFRFSVLDIKRGVAPRRMVDSSVVVTGSCDYRGIINIKVESENGIDPCNYGFYIYGSKGQIPEGLIPGYPRQPLKWDDQCILSLSWKDGTTSTQESIKFNLQFEAVNHILYKGDRSEKVLIQHKGN